MEQKHIERSSIFINSIINMIITACGIFVFIVTDIQALFLDACFSLIALISSIVAIIISKISSKKTKHYPDGIYYLEPLYAIIRSFLILILITYTLCKSGISAYNYFVYGTGNIMNIGPVLPYSISMVILSFGLYFFNSSQNKKINNTSTILTAESKINFVDGLQSLGIVLGVIILSLIDVESPLGFLYYTGDFFVTLTIVIVSLKRPIKVLISSFRELSGGLINDEIIKETIYKTVTKHLGGILKEFKCDIFKVGMHIKVRVSIYDRLNNTYDLIKIKNEIFSELNSIYENIDVVFKI